MGIRGGLDAVQYEAAFMAFLQAVNAAVFFPARMHVQKQERCPAVRMPEKRAGFLWDAGSCLFRPGCLYFGKARAQVHRPAGKWGKKQ